MFVENPTISDIEQMLINVINITGKSLRTICVDYFNDVSLYKNLKRLLENKMPRKNGLLYKKACGFYKYKGFEKENLLPMIARYICTQLAFIPNSKSKEFRPWFDRKDVHVYNLSTKMIYYTGSKLENGWWNLSYVKQVENFKWDTKDGKKGRWINSPFNDGKLWESKLEWDLYCGKRSSIFKNEHERSIKWWTHVYFLWAKQKGNCKNPLITVFYQNGKHYFIIEEIYEGLRVLVRRSSGFTCCLIYQMSINEFWIKSDKKSYWIDDKGHYHFMQDLDFEKGKAIIIETDINLKPGKWLSKAEANKIWNNKNPEAN